MAFSCFRYNTAVLEAIRMTPYNALYGTKAFDFDAEVALRMVIYEDAQSNEELGKKIAELHSELRDRSSLQKVTAKKQYDKLAAGFEYEVGDRVMGYNPLNGYSVLKEAPDSMDGTLSCAREACFYCLDCAC